MKQGGRKYLPKHSNIPYQIYMAELMFKFTEQHGIQLLTEIHLMREATFFQEPVEHLSNITTTIV